MLGMGLAMGGCGTSAQGIGSLHLGQPGFGFLSHVPMCRIAGTQAEHRIVGQAEKQIVVGCGEAA